VVVVVVLRRRLLRVLLLPGMCALLLQLLLGVLQSALHLASWCHRLSHQEHLQQQQ
jgi:hypothetical protein